MYTLLYFKWITNKNLLSTLGTLLNIIWQLDGRRVWGRMHTFIRMAASLHCSPETITTLSISYTPVQNAFGVKK